MKLRSRVLSHFSGDHASGKELRMCQDTVHVEYIETPGELSALFLESRKVKELMPTYNRMLRNSKALAIIRSRTDARGYALAEAEYEAEIDPSSMQDIIAVCRSKAQAKAFMRTLAKEHALCTKLLGLDKSGAGACFNRQLEACRGACAGEEDASAYNERFDEAFEAYKLIAWPFQGPILIKDETEEGEGVAYVIHNWCVVEMVEYSGDSASSQQIAEVFDLDSYKILLRFLKDPKKTRGRVEPLPADYFKARAKRELAHSL